MNRARRTAGRRRTRREFLRRAGRAAAGAALVGASVWSIGTFLDGRREPPRGARGRLGILRPPGALDEPSFLARCIRCTRCSDVCRPGAIRLFPPGEGEQSGTPYLLAEERGCNLCLECIDACPAGALAPVERKEDARMGTAVVDERLCVSLNGTGVCGACHTACPLRNRALTQDYRNAPVVHPDVCVGCGLCEEACIVLENKAIRVVTGRRWREG